MNELQIFIMVISGAILFRLGGWVNKAFRRYLMPLVFAGVLWWAGFAIWQCLASMVLLSAALHLGYGQTKPFWYKLMVACSWVIPSLLLGYSLWLFITPIVFFVFFMLSNWKKTEQAFVWSVVEMFTGACIGTTYALIRGWGL